MKSFENTIINIGDLFFQFQAKIQFFEREYLRKYGIEEVTPNEVKVLYIIGISNTKSMSEIADELKITRGTLSIAINTLVKKGYVIRTRNKQDRRIIILYLTKQSIGIVKHYAKFYETLLIALAKSMTDGKIVVMEEMLEKLNKIVETNFYENVEDYKNDNIKDIIKKEEEEQLVYEEEIE
jgi:DNA-binding MarR family transcriptional regulator